MPNTADPPRARVMLVSARIVSTRFWACVQVCTRATRGRVRSRQARISGGGIQRGVLTPGASSAAIPVAARLSVFCPGRCRPSRRLARGPSTVSLRTWDAGCQYPPVLSSAPMGHCCACYQGRTATSAAEVVPYSTNSVGIWPAALPRRQHAVRCAACPSLPQHTGGSTCSVRPFWMEENTPQRRQRSRLQRRLSHA